MTKKYSLIKRVVQSIPGLREALAGAFMLLPKPLSATAYAALRKYVFRDNQPRLDAFAMAFEHMRSLGHSHVQYYEFGVARGTSVIASYMLARSKGLDLAVYAFDSFAGLPSSEGGFVAGDMAYSEATFRRFTDKAGVPSAKVQTIPGFFNVSLTPALKTRLGVKPAVAIFHNDSDLYESTKDVLAWIDDLALPGSVLIFDDWHSFAGQGDPAQFGEQRAFAEYASRGDWDLCYEKPEGNVAFVRIR